MNDQSYTCATETRVGGTLQHLSTIRIIARKCRETSLFLKANETKLNNLQHALPSSVSLPDHRHDWTLDIEKWMLSITAQKREEKS